MKVKLLESRERKTYAVILDKGEELLSELRSFARDRMLVGSHFAGIGACRRVTLGYFDPDRMDYRKIPIEEQVEILTLTGNVTIEDGEPKIHAHAVVGKADASAHGGHVLEATVWPTLEVIIEESPNFLQRRTDEETGLALIKM